MLRDFGKVKMSFYMDADDICLKICKSAKKIYNMDLEKDYL